MGGAARGVGVMGVTRATPEEVRAWVKATCAAQGIPVKVTDPAVLAATVALLGQTRQTGSRRPGSKRLRPGTAARTMIRSRIDATIAR
jgi:hypothetical protein